MDGASPLAVVTPGASSIVQKLTGTAGVAGTASAVSLPRQEIQAGTRDWCKEWSETASTARN